MNHFNSILNNMVLARESQINCHGSPDTRSFALTVSPLGRGLGERSQVDYLGACQVGGNLGVLVGFCCVLFYFFNLICFENVI